jgi:frataxin
MPAIATTARSFHSTGSFSKGLQPDTENPQPPATQTPAAGAAAHVTEPTPLSAEEYYEYSEHYFNVLLGELERAQEEGSDVEAEYSVSAIYLRPDQPETHPAQFLSNTTPTNLTRPAF